MKTYQETLKHIKLNKHLYEDDISWAAAGKLDSKLLVVAYIFSIPLITVINDYADII